MPKTYNGVPLDFLQALEAAGDGEPVAKKLALTVRPSFVADDGRTQVWGDWSNIEARVLPWLAASPGAERKLDIFRAVDKDPSMPDVYISTAADLLNADPVELWSFVKNKTHPEHKQAKGYRQSHGKVPELSLGFGGGLGALMAMATNYGVYLEETTALDMIERWRSANKWAKAFWGSHGREGSFGLWGAVNSAIENPNTIFTAGRVAYVYDPDYLDGTLFCALPSGRLLSYPKIKWEWREVENKKTGKMEDRYQLTFLKAYGRSALWYGKCAENITQAEAASVLRRTLKRLRRLEQKDLGPCNVWMPVTMHTHDEIVTEPPLDLADEAATVLKREMERNDAWDEGLPLAAEITTNWYYSKVED